MSGSRRIRSDCAPEWVIHTGRIHRNSRANEQWNTVNEPLNSSGSSGKSPRSGRLNRYQGGLIHAVTEAGSPRKRRGSGAEAGPTQLQSDQIAHLGPSKFRRNSRGNVRTKKREMSCTARESK
mgnify:CR=1 FL=1